MTTKRWTLCFLLLSAVTLTLFAGIMYVTDPLIRYGTESKLFSYYEYSELYSNPGIAKNYRYDTVLVGTSMIQNTDVQECNELLGCDMVRLPYPGGTSYNMKTILDICFASDNTVETVYWELDEHQLFGVHDAPRDPLPDYLYRSDHLQDLSYLLNLDIFFHYDLKNLRGTLQGIEQPVAREGETLTGDFSEKATLSSYNRPNKAETSASSEQYIADAKRNLESNIIPLVEANPDTEFVFFTVPFSILYWDREMQNGTFDAVMDGLEYALER
ncbi:MAG: hypothetical protein IJ386_03815, partial [Clostridia bacterium]|nr:hypothetical protein [Clostridia bacterium]